MALRHKYGFNCQVLNWGGLNEMVPAGYLEVAPGETIHGSISLNVRSQPTELAIDTRAYVDAFAFYVPFRLLWSEFPAFVSGGSNPSAIPTMPLLTNLWPFNFETRFSVPNAGGTGFDRNTPFMRYAFNAIWNQYFRMPDQVPRAVDANNLAYVSQRSSTMETKPLLNQALNVDTTIPLQGTSPNQSISVNAVRAGLAQDRFNRMKNWYGSKYVDYLAMLGVETEWSLLMEPELIAQKHQDWRYKAVSQTSPGQSAPQDVVGQQAGHFQSTVTLNVPRKFFSEHGLICVYVATRADGVFAEPPQPPILCKSSYGQYWSPEWETVVQTGQSTTAALTKPIFIPDSVYANRWDFSLPQFEEYRSGLNYNRPITNGPMYGLVNTQTTLAATKYLRPVQSDYSVNFTQDAVQEFQACAQYRLVRHSPVRRVDTRLKLA